MTGATVISCLLVSSCRMNSKTSFLTVFKCALGTGELQVGALMCLYRDRMKRLLLQNKPASEIGFVGTVISKRWLTTGQI